MKFARQVRPLIIFIRSHSFSIGTQLTIAIIILFFRKEIRYHFYTQRLHIIPYQSAVTIWSSDYHISPIHDLKNILLPLGVKIFDKILSGSCSRTGTCSSHLRVLNRENGMNPSSSVRQKFYQFYQNQIEMNTVDAFVCFHPVSMCELYMPFNRSLIIIASTRYELWRFEVEQWKNLNERLIEISRDPKNLIAANNLYDAEYIRYFTGINAVLLPSFCNYTNSRYHPRRKEFLLASIHALNFQPVFQTLLKASLNTYGISSIKIVSISSIYPEYQYSDLTNHPAIIHIPYQVSIMSLFEQYRMNIPLIFPSLDLLTDWHYDYGLVSERTWDQALQGIRPNRSHIEGVLKNVPDPNNDLDRAAIRYWLNFSDFYQWPHITYFDSTDDLILKLNSTDFQQVSRQMKEYNKQFESQLFGKWKQILNNIKQYSRKFRTLRAIQQEMS